MTRLLATVYSFLLLAGAGLAQAANRPNEDAAITRDDATGTYGLSWWGRAGITYFIQHSDDLITWSYLPVIESGADTVVQWGFTSTADKFFLRLKSTSAPTGGDPFTADFDGDGVNNWQELLGGTDPLQSGDADGDGLPDNWELTYLGTLAKGPGDSAGLAGGQTLLQAYQQGLIPTFYGNQLPTLTIVSGDHQGAERGLPLAAPLVVRVANSTGSVYQNVPIYFSTTGGGLLTVGGGGTSADTVQVRTSPQGLANAQAITPGDYGPFQVTAGTQPSGSFSPGSPSPVATGASVSLSAIAGHPSAITFHAKTSSLGSQNPGIPQYNTPYPSHWYLIETSESHDDPSAGGHASYKSELTLHPFIGPATYTGHAEQHYEYDYDNGHVDTYDSNADQSPHGDFWFGSETFTCSTGEDPEYSNPIFAPYYEGVCLPIFRDSETQTRRTYSNYEETGSETLSKEYLGDAFANDLINALPPVVPAPSVDMSSIAYRFVASDGSSVFAGKAAYTVEVPPNTLSARYQWFEVFTPTDAFDRPIAEGVTLERKTWDFVNGTDPASQEFFVNPNSKSVNGYWGLLPVDITVRKKSEADAPETGLVVKKGEVVTFDINGPAPASDFPLPANTVKWKTKQLKSDGTYTGWTDVPGEGPELDFTTNTSGIFQAKAVLTVAGGQPQDLPLVRMKDELKTSNGYMGPGRKGQPDAFGVCDTQKQVDIQAEAKRYFGSPAYGPTTSVPAEYGFGAYPATGNSIIRCNIFVAHRCCAVGATVPAINGNGFTSFYPPLANQWAGIEDCTPHWEQVYNLTFGVPWLPTTNISGWPILATTANPQPGYIIAHPQPGDAGHCAIIDYDGGGIGAGTSGTVNKNYPDFYDGTSRFRLYQP